MQIAKFLVAYLQRIWYIYHNKGNQGEKPMELQKVKELLHAEVYAGGIFHRAA